ncbi:hypothetical protein BH10PSE17_BH10PSE17_11340 [soil metagenome]
MVFFRILAGLVLLIAAVSFGAWLVTRQRRFLAFGVLMLKLLLATGLVLFGLLALERVVMLV